MTHDLGWLAEWPAAPVMLHLGALLLGERLSPLGYVGVGGLIAGLAC